VVGNGCPKYGDYNGNACAAGRLFAGWASATSPAGIEPPSTAIGIFFDSFPLNRPPDCGAAAADPGMLWSPNHLLRAISVVGVTDPDGDPVTITATGVSQDEAVAGGESGGAGNTSPDAALSPLAVRAERNGNPTAPGNGRVYHIDFGADDSRGGTCAGTVTVCVPGDQGRGTACSDGGRLYDSIP
jgi:hypothetical protein